MTRKTETKPGDPGGKADKKASAGGRDLYSLPSTPPETGVAGGTPVISPRPTKPPPSPPTASGTPNIASGTPNIGSGTPDIGSGTADLASGTPALPKDT